MQNLPTVGDTIDDMYEIKEMIGQGGFGAVFLAKHLPMDRDVAFKMLTTAAGAKPGEMAERFRREVMAIRNLCHPNTVRIFDFRDHENGMLYYTMEYLQGYTLKDLIKNEGAQSPKRVRHIIKQILKSLSEAHSFGIVHRDLKPANLMLVDMHGEVDFVKVLDFGIAKLMGTDEEEDEDDPLTSAGMLVGTLRYMAPEQITGIPLGPYTDLYALALITIELLTGQSVFSGTGRWDILQQQISELPVSLPDAIKSTPLATIISKALEKRIETRYQNALEMVADLEAIPDSELAAHALTSDHSGQIATPPDTGDPTLLTPQPSILPGDAVPVYAQEHATAHTSSTDADPSLPSYSSSSDPMAQTTQHLPRAGTSSQLPTFNTPLPDTTPSSTADTGEFAPSLGHKKIIPIALMLLIILMGAAAVAILQFKEKNTSGTEGNTHNTMTKIASSKTNQPDIDTKALGSKTAIPKATQKKPSKQIWIKTNGPTARVFLDGILLGKTPYKHEVTTQQSLTLKADGFADKTIHVDMTMNAEEHVTAVLDKLIVPATLTKTPDSSLHKKPIKKPVKKPTKKPIKKPIKKPVKKPTKKPIKEPGWINIKKDPKKTKPNVPIFGQ